MNNYERFQSTVNCIAPESPHATELANPADIAKSLVYGDRHESYGHPLDDFSKTAKMWSAILGVDVTAEQVAMCMVAVKLSRQVHRQKFDNLVDSTGYVLTLHEVIQERARRESK